MARITWKDSDPSDPMYSEGPRSYSPHWAQEFRRPRTPSPPSTVGQQTHQPASGKPDDRKATERDDDVSRKDHSDLVERKKALPLDSAENQLINRMLTNLRVKHAAELKERELRKLDPKRQDLVRRIMADHPEWGPEELQRLHDDLDEWGE